MAKIKDNEKISKGERGKQRLSWKGTPARVSANFLTETLQAKKEWHDIFKVLKGENMQRTQQGYHSELKERFKKNYSQTNKI